MAVKVYNPTSNGQRNRQSLTFEELTGHERTKSLTKGKSESAGRSNGRISVRRRGAGHKSRIEPSILREIKSAFPVKLSALSTILTVRHLSR